MAKAFLSILGTNDYLECRHIFNNNLLDNKPTKYVQEDLINYFCKEWDHAEYRIFLTQDARKKNWLDNGHEDKKTNTVIKNIGLERRLIQNTLKGNIKGITIPDGNNEKELWEIFEIIYNSIQQEDEIIIDVTHSFRFLPMLLTVILNFAKQTKKIKILGIYYAAFETLGPIPEIINLPVIDRIVPVFDLTPLVKLQDWSIATFNYSKHADIQELKLLVKNELKSIIANQGALNDTEFLLRKTIELLEELSYNISICRGNEIINFDYNDLRKKLIELKKSEIIIKPFASLIDAILMKIEGFNNYEIMNGFLAVEWCLKHNLFQQAITLLQEVIITNILLNIDLESDKLLNRELVTKAIKIYSQQIPELKWRDKAKEFSEIIRRILTYDDMEKICPNFEKLTKIRNDVNHAGFIEGSRNFSSIKEKLFNSFAEIKNLF